MDKKELSKNVDIRPYGTIVIADSILCDGDDPFGQDIGKNLTCYSHIHDDHIKGLDDRLGVSHSQVYSTEITKRLASALYQRDTEWIKDRQNYSGLEYNDQVDINANLRISFKICHHILGSASILVNANKNSILYSSDFMLKGTHVEKDVDYLILDATHGAHSENQEFEDVVPSKRKLVKLVREIIADAEGKGDPPRINIHAHRGTMQLAMSWLRDEINVDTKFLTNRKDLNVARIYSEYGHECGDLYDEDIQLEKFFRSAQSFVHFLPINEMPTECEVIEPIIPSIRIGASTNTDIANPEKMHRINLKEHATVLEVKEYVKLCNPKHVIIDNSARVPNSDNASFLGNEIRLLGYDVTLLPEKHPNAT